MKTDSACVRYAGERLLLRAVYCALAVGFALLVAPKLWDILSPFVIALLVAAALQPPIRFGQEKLHMRRGLAAGLCVALVVLIAFALLYWFASFAVVQLVNAAENAQSIVGTIISILQTAADRILDMAQSLPQDVGIAIRASLDQAFKSLSDAGMSLEGSMVNYAVGVAAGVPYAFIYANFLILGTVFITNRYEGIAKYFNREARMEGEKNIRVLRQSAGKGMIGYIRVQLLFSFLTLLLSWVFFQAVGFQYAFLIGFIAALLELIPQFGCGTLYLPWCAVCFIVGATHNGWLVLGLYLGYSLIRRVTEPALLGTNLGVSPLLSLIGMFVGMRTGGVVGLILGPIVMVILVSAVRAKLFNGVLADARAVIGYMKERWQRGRASA